mgnify:CR=1 FL=1
MNQQIKQIGLWIAGAIEGILLIYVVILIIPVIPAIGLSPFIIFEIIKDGGWSEISLYYKLIIICGSLIFTGAVIKELWSLVIWIKEKIK